MNSKKYFTTSLFGILVSILYSTVLISQNKIDNTVSHYLSDKEAFKKSCLDLINTSSNKEEMAIGSALLVLTLDPSKNRDSIDQLITVVSNCKSQRCNAYHAVAQCRVPLTQERGQEAIDFALEAIHLLDREEDPYMFILMNQSAAGCYYWMADYERASHYVHIALEAAIALDYSWSIAAAYDLLANGWTGVDEIKADSFRQLYYTTIESIEDTDYEFTKYTNQGFALQEQDRDDSARIFFQKAFDLAVSIEDRSLELEALTYLAENSFWQKKYKECIAQYELAVTYPEEFLNAPGASRAYNFWSQAEAALGNHQNAYEYMRRYKEIDDEYWDYASREQTNALEAQYQNAKKESQLAQQQLQLQKRTSQRNLAYAGGIGLLMLGTFFFYRNRKNKKLNESRIDNLEKQQKLIALDYMVQGQEEERKRIAEDLHDGLGGLLSSARFQMQAIHKEMDKLQEMDLFAKAEDMIDNACTEVRRIAHDMMPGALIDLGLTDAIEDLITKITSKHGIKYDFDYDESIAFTDLQSIQLYRIIQEATNNTIKHAKAKLITCQLNQTKSTIQLVISDNGIGFDTEKLSSSKGIGIQNIKSRVQYLNGTLLISSSPEKGTSYTIDIRK